MDTQDTKSLSITCQLMELISVGLFHPIAATNKPCHGQLTIHIGALIFKTPHDSDKIILLYVSRLVQGEL